MTTTAEKTRGGSLPKTIRATIHEDAIRRVPSFFNASTRDILNELLQNARRAGATRVNMTRCQRTLTVEDDGDGVADPAALLGFGHSGWSTERPLNEHPAGMGIYALARREGVTVRSQTRWAPPWHVNLQRENFTGEQDAAIESWDGRDDWTGTEVTFGYDFEPIYEIKAAAKHYPLPVFVDGEEQPREEYLEKCSHTEAWRGVRIGVMKNMEPTMNFHGIVVMKTPLPTVSDLEHKWAVMVDVHDCPELELTLPARRDVIENEFMQDLKQKCLEIIYRAIAVSDEHADLPKAAVEDANQMGIELPEARRALRRWVPKDANTHRTARRGDRTPLGDSTVILAEGYGDYPDSQTLHRAIVANRMTHRFVAANRMLEGYEWYDQLPRVSLNHIYIEEDGVVRDLMTDRFIRKPTESGSHADAVRFVLGGPALGENITLDTDLAFEKLKEENCWEARPIVTHTSFLRGEDLENLIIQSFFNPSDEAGKDSPQTQEERVRYECRRRANLFLNSGEDTYRNALAEAVERHVRRELPSGKSATILLHHDRPAEVLLEDCWEPGTEPGTELDEHSEHGELVAETEEQNP